MNLNELDKLYKAKDSDVFPLPHAIGKIVHNENDSSIDFQITVCSNSFAQIFQVEKSFLQTKKLSELAPFFDRIFEKNLIQNKILASSKQDFQMETYSKTLNTWISIHLAQLGTDLLCLIINKNIQNNEQDILTTSTKKHSIQQLDNLPIGVYQIDPNGKILLVNHALNEILGYTKDNELIGSNINQKRFFINYSVDEIYSILKEQGTITGLETTWQTNEGKALYMLESVTLIDSDLDRNFIIEGTVEDISAKKIAENQLSQLNDIFYDLDADPEENIHRIVKKTNYILNGVCSMFNRLDEKNNSLILWSEHQAPESLKRKDDPGGHICYEATIKGIDQTIILPDLEKTEYRNKDTNVKKYNLKSYLGHPVTLNEQSIGSLCIVDQRVRNFTETEVRIIKILAKALSLELDRLNLTTKLKHAVDEAVDANQAKTRFLANMSHEIRTPLNGILGFAEMLRTQEEDLRKKRMLGLIENSGSDLLRIISDIFDYSLLEAGKISQNNTSFKLSKTIDDLVKTFERQAIDKGLEIVFANDNIENYYLWGDQNKFNQILVNLLSNAIKFTDEGSIFILPEVTRNTAEVLVKVSIEDTGVGIHKDQLKYIFKEFEQLEFYLTKKIKGTGLGLAITKKLIEQLKGNIEVESELGRGSRFIVEIPFQTKANQKTETIMESQTEMTTGSKSNIKILLAEDNEANQFLIKAITKTQDWDITVVDDGQQAVEAFKAETYDLILMDVQMPIMNGYEATKLIREIEKERGVHTPIIALTAYAMKSDKDQCLEAGMDDYVSKPFKRQEFLDSVLKRIP